MSDPNVISSPRWPFFSRFKSRAVEALFFVPPSIFMGWLIHIRQLRAGSQSSVWIWILDTLIFWLFWWLVLPLLRFFVARWTDQGRILERHIIYHVLAAVPVALLHLAVSVYGSILVFGEDPGWTYFVGQYVPTALRFLPLSMLIYMAIVGVMVAVALRRRLQEEESRLLRSREEAVRAQLASLQGQVNPHFLFNTLNSLDVLIRSGQSESASTLLHQLSDLLRTTLSHEAVPIHTLSAELQIVNTYLAIETTRFADRLHIERDIDTEALDTALPVFSLQTLVENAIRHGIAQRVSEGVVRIRVVHQTDSMLLQVSDNGPGTSGQNSPAQKSGVGLTNLRRRLELLYQKKHLLVHSRSEDDFTCYTLTIPKLSDKERA